MKSTTFFLECRVDIKSVREGVWVDIVCLPLRKETANAP